MKWNNFVEHIKTLGFEGLGDDFTAVQVWLKDNGHDADEVVTADNERFKLKELYDQRPGKPLDVSEAAKKAQFQDEVRKQARAEVEELRRNGVISDARPRKPEREHPHDVKVLDDEKRGGFKTFGHLVHDVIRAGRKDNRKVSETLERWDSVTKAALSTYGNENVGTDGGFAVPPEFRDGIMKFVEGEDSLLSRCDQHTMARNSLTFTTDETNPWGTDGVQGGWEGEASVIGQSKPKLTQKEVRARKYATLVPVSEELMEDAPFMSSYITRLAGEKINWAVDHAIMWGTGAGQPFGFMNSSTLISVAKESSQGADTVVASNIFKIWVRMFAKYRNNAIWLANQDVEVQLMKLSFPGIKNSGGAATNWGVGGIYLPGGSIAGSPNATLLGRPVLYTQHCETLGDQGDIALVDLKQYLVAGKGGVNSQSSIHFWFDQDVTALRFTIRLDGQPWRNTTISPRDGSNTMSAFVTLDARA